MGREILVGERNWEIFYAGECIEGSCMMSVADWMLLGD